MSTARWTHKQVNNPFSPWYAVAGGLEVCAGTVSIPISIEVSAAAAAKMAGGVVTAAATQNIVYSKTLAGQSGGGEHSNINDSVEITLKYKDGMPARQFERKANALKDLEDQGLLRKAANPVPRDPGIARKYKQDMIKRIWNQYGKRNPEFANNLINKIKKDMQPDHVWELQLNGPDDISNLRFLDSFTNWDIGTQQIRPQIRDLETGTRITIRIEK